MKSRIKATLLFYIGYILLAALSIINTMYVLPIRCLFAVVVWTFLAWIFYKTSKNLRPIDAILTLSFSWLFTFIAMDFIIMHIKPEFAVSTPMQYLWLVLTCFVTFVAPFIAYSMYCKYLKMESAKSIPGKKIIIIGGGIGGLTAAVYAAKAGFETELYEQHTIVGGECTGWDRKGYHIDNCIHWMIGTNPGTDLNKMWQTIGAIGEGVGIHREDRMYTSEHNGQQLTLWADIDRTEREMIALSPEDEPQIRKLMQDCRLAQKVSIPAAIPSELMSISDMIKMIKTSKSFMKLNKEYKGMNVQDLMDKFKHPLIQCLISDFTPADSNASSFPMAYGNFVSGDGGIPVGGSRATALRIKEKAESYGAKIYTGKNVTKIKLEENNATGIVLGDGTEITADYIIPACDTSVTFGKFLPDSYMTPLMRDMYADRKAYPVYNTFQVAFALDYSEDLFSAEIIWDCPELVFTEGMGKRITVKSYGYEPSFAPQEKQILQTLQGGSENVFNFWTELYKDKKVYQAKKLELAQQTLEQLEMKFPKLKGRLTILDVWTPMTYVRYCSAYKGFYQSFMITKYSAKMPYPSAYIKGIDNVILGGQWINPPGGLPGAATAGKFAVQRILAKEGRDYSA